MRIRWLGWAGVEVEEQGAHVVAFARTHETGTVIVAVPRLIAKLMKCQDCLPVGLEVWRDTAIQLSCCKPGMPFRNLFTDQVIETQSGNDRTVLWAKDLFADFSVALLTNS